MDERPSFRYSFCVAAVMLTLILLFFMFVGLTTARYVDDIPEMAIDYLETIVVPIAGAFACTAAILFGIDWLNRRDDPHFAKRPPDDP
jgi:hypothetical protein